MALRGKIDDFGIAEIFQLIGQQQRTGILTVHSGNKVAEIFFVNGMISKVNPLYLSPKRTPLGDCLVKAKLISEENLQRALKKQGETLRSLEEVLLNLQLLNQEQLQRVNEYLVFEALYDVMEWKEGEYELNLKEIEHDERLGNLMSIEHIILDVLRMIDEEPELSRLVPSRNTVFQKSSLEDIQTEDINGEQGFGAYEKIVFGLVDGATTVQAIIDKSLLGRYNTTKALANLHNAGIINKKTSAEPGTPQRILPREKVFRYVFCVGFPVIITLLLIALKLLGKAPPPPEGLVFYSPKVAIAKTQLLKIKNALNGYFLQNGQFPNALEHLTQDHFLPPEELRYPAGVRYTYDYQKDGGYQLNCK